jgi:Arc/MetJ-type ribon-helix-helix transcriptional regulator
MARTVQARLDDASEGDLSLLRNLGHSDSEAIRIALREAADRRRRKSAVRAEAREAAEDPEDRAEAQRILEEMEAISAFWVEPD